MLPKDTIIEGVSILSISKPPASKDYACAWGCGCVIPKGRLHVKAVWKDRRVDKDNPKVNTDRICIECWTK
jgi:hypothetical protein